jgi:hypothetical protein
MAIVVAEAFEMGEAAEASESTATESVFKQDSAENASAKGVDLQGVGKVLGEGYKLVMSILSLVRAERKGAQETEDRKQNRYRAGIVFEPEESRNDLIVKGLMPAYYSSSNIKALLSGNKLPYGWSEEAAVKQGFGVDIRAGEFRRRNKIQVDNINKYYDDKLALSKQLAEADALNSRLRLNRSLQQLKL